MASERSTDQPQVTLLILGKTPDLKLGTGKISSDGVVGKLHDSAAETETLSLPSEYAGSSRSYLMIEPSVTSPVKFVIMCIG